MNRFTPAAIKAAADVLHEAEVDDDHPEPHTTDLAWWCSDVAEDMLRAASEHTAPEYRNTSEEAWTTVCDLLVDYQRELAEGGIYTKSDLDVEYEWETTKRFASSIMTAVSELARQATRKVPNHE